MYGEYCYYIKGEGKDRVRGNETSIYPEFLKPNTNIGVGNLPLNGVISDNRTYPGKTAGVLSGKRAPELMNMDLGAISARQSAPTDGRGQSTNTNGQSIFLTSKQNSDASGMFYQWGRKDPFTFATNSEKGGVGANDYGKYPVKIYTIDGVLIYQESNGDGNKDKQPVGGIIYSSIVATSMMDVIKNPMTFYGNLYNTNISQVGHTRDLWDHYWTSYSRGTDGLSTWNIGLINKLNQHNKYLDGYTLQRSKSIYDPCPYGFIAPSNGTFNQTTKQSWLSGNYASGYKWMLNSNSSWIGMVGCRLTNFSRVGTQIMFSSSTTANVAENYSIYLILSEIMYNVKIPNSRGLSVRCIEDCDPQRSPDDPRNAQIITLEKQTFNLNNVCNPTV